MFKMKIPAYLLLVSLVAPLCAPPTFAQDAQQQLDPAQETEIVTLLDLKTADLIKNSTYYRLHKGDKSVFLVHVTEKNKKLIEETFTKALTYAPAEKTSSYSSITNKIALSIVVALAVVTGASVVVGTTGIVTMNAPGIVVGGYAFLWGSGPFLGYEYVMYKLGLDVAVGSLTANVAFTTAYAGIYSVYKTYQGVHSWFAGTHHTQPSVEDASREMSVSVSDEVDKLDPYQYIVKPVDSEAVLKETVKDLQDNLGFTAE